MTSTINQDLETLCPVPAKSPEPQRGQPSISGKVQIASPHFRFPRKPPTTAVVPSTAPTLPVEIDSVAGPNVAPLADRQWSLHGPHGKIREPHFEVTEVEEFEGWTVQNVGPSTQPSIAEALNEIPIHALSASENSPVTSQPVNEAIAISKAPQVDSWEVASRAKVTGYDLMRTRVDQTQAILTGSKLAAEHRRWAARNQSAELQLATTRDSAIDERRNEAGNRQRRSIMNRVPLSVYPDFRWPLTIDALSQLSNPFSAKLLDVAGQLLAAGQSRLVVAGSRRQQGTSTIAGTIAKMLIQQQKRVLLVDGDLAQAGLTAQFGLLEAGSWAEQIQHFGPLVEAMSISRKSSAAFVGVTAVRPRSSLPPFLFDYLGQLLQTVSRDFDAVVIDAGPVSQLLEELSQPRRLANSLLIVQHAGEGASNDFLRVKTTLNAFGISRLAVAQNFAA